MQVFDYHIAPVLSPDRTMEIVLEAIAEIVPYELAVVLSMESNNMLKVRHARGPLYTPRLRGHTLSLDERPELAEIIARGRAHLFKDEPEHGVIHRDTYDEILELPAGHSCLVAPLYTEGKNLGLLTLDHRACNVFTPQIVRTTEILARLITLALAQSMIADTLLNERDTLLLERNNLLADLPKSLEGLVGNSPVWLEVLEKIRMVAPAHTPVLIVGETGTGKEQVARAVHSLSERAQRPFVALNCSTLVSTLAESELFGHERGAFTGAVSRRRGRFELANNTTLFLDEIGDLPLQVQPKLLRALQEQTFLRVGGEVPITSDVRIICATHLDLENAVREKQFRADLFYRLNVFPIHLPPLPERGDDVLLLADHFLKKLSGEFNRKEFILSPDAMEFLRKHRWPGNVRELQNRLERAVILCKGNVIEAEHLELKKKRGRPAEGTGSGAAMQSETIESFDQAVRRHILKALERSDGKIYGETGAAALLDMKPTTLQSKMRKLGIRR